MRDIMWFAIYSARRESEICRLEWADNHQRGRTGLVRDAKHPRYKEGNHRRFKLTTEAWEIIERQPKTSEYIFPYDPKSVSAAFTRACHILGIQDLRFHDLRHEATSRLFERGYQIHEVAQFTPSRIMERAEEVHQPSARKCAGNFPGSVKCRSHFRR
jgi:integrase